MRYTAAARREELRFSARMFVFVAACALAIAGWGWVDLHSPSITGFHLLIVSWCVRQAHLDAACAAQIGEH